MVTRAQMVELQQGNAQIRRLLERDIRQLWQNVDVSDRSKFRQVILDNVPALVDEYGKVSASLAAEFFEDIVGRPPVVAAANLEATTASARWAIGPVWDDQPEKALGLLTGSMTRHAVQAGRDTIHNSTLNTRGITYARVPGGSDTCAFCVMLASRGSVYGSEALAGGVGNEYHDKCSCEPVPIRDESEYPPGYNPDEMYEQYKAVHQYMMTGKEAAAAMRQAYDMR